MENKNNTHDNGNNTANPSFFSTPHESLSRTAGKGGKGAHKEGEEKRAEQMTEKDHREVRASNHKTEAEDMADIGQVGRHASDHSKKDDK